MKKIIDRVVYNTKKATLLYSFWNGLSRGDHRHLEEELYVTANGRFFLAGHGGAHTCYAESCGNASWEGSDLIPLSENDTIEWLEAHDGEEVLLSRFAHKLKDA